MPSFVGFEKTDRVHVVAATNCPTHLDEALRRRFDEQLDIPLPDGMLPELLPCFKL